MNRHWTIAMWLRLQEPRIITLAQTVIYALCAAAGVATVASPPPIVEGQFGIVVTLAWGWLAVVGGVAGAVACPSGKWLIEKPAIILCATSTILYAGIILTLQLQGHDNRLPQFFFTLIALLYFASRYARIRPFSYQPGK